jgi:hypothetical protein
MEERRHRNVPYPPPFLIWALSGVLGIVKELVSSEASIQQCPNLLPVAGRQLLALVGLGCCQEEAE